MDQDKALPIIEVYPCLQSEGKLAGVPHILIRTTGCVLRCQFSETDFCDSWYTSWTPEKGEWTWRGIEKVLEANIQIKHVMVTGGSPTMHPELLRFITTTLHSRGYYITLETEGSKFIEECHVDLLSLSPKMSNSIPRIGTETPDGKVVTIKNRDRHEKNRKNYSEMSKWISSSKDYQFKPVLSSMSDIEEITDIAKLLEIPREKTWLMPAGGTSEILLSNMKWVMEYAWKNGYNYTGREHILVYNDQRGV